MGRLRRPVALRTQLIAAILALMAAVCVVIGVTTTVVMRDQLIRQLDAQLAAASERSNGGGGGYNDPHQGGPPEFLVAPGQAAGTLGARIVDGEVAQAGQLDRLGKLKAIELSECASLASLPTDGRPHTVDLGALGEYRAIAARQGDGDIKVTALPLSYANAAVNTLILAEIGVGLGGLVLAAVAGWLIVRLALRPLRRVAATAGRVAELPLAKGEVDLSVRVPDADTDPRTEVGQVGSALNRMLGHVATALAARHASETRVRQFVADASHELRTPLAAIRGYAELTRRGRDTVPPDVAHALNRVESESARMTTLVDDLLLLARLDSGRPLASEPVDLSRLLVDTISDAQAAGRDHKWLLDLPEDPVSVVGDPDRLHQVLANLLANGRTHTPPGTTITTSLAVRNDWAIIRVVDNGPGIPANLQPEIFERFARGDSSRSRAEGSTGLGLSIVAAVVGAHHGELDVTSRPGHTVFEVHLPGASISV